MEVPLEVIIEPLFAQPPVLAVMAFEPGEIAFQAIGGSWDQGIIQVMEQVWQGSQQHASGALDVAEDLAFLSPLTYLGAVLVFPLSNSPQEPVSFYGSANGSHLEEDLPEAAAIGTLGGVAAPGQALALDVDQAALDRYTWPQFPEDFNDMGVAINREAVWAHFIVCQAPEEGKEPRLRVLRDSVLTSQKLMGLSIHQGDETVWAMEEGAIEDEGQALIQACRRLRRHLLQVAIDHAIKLSGVVAALKGDLADGISFNNPTSEPFLLVGVSGPGVAPAERALASLTKPPLPAIGIMTIPFGGRSEAARAAFFCS